MSQYTGFPVIRILLADDHGIVRAGIRQFLEKEPRLQVVGEATDGKSALRMVSELLPDIVLMDIQMPEMSGMDVTRRLRLAGVATKVLILSAYDDLPFIRAAIKAGADGYMVKTADPAEIIHAIHRVCRGEKAYSADVLKTLEERLMIPDELDRELVTGRELEVLLLAAQGLSNRQIAIQMQLSERTVQNHMAHIFQRLGVNSRTEAVTKALAVGLVTLPGTGRGEG